MLDHAHACAESGMLQPRYELYLKAPADLKLQAQLLRGYPLNLPNKTQEDLVSAVGQLKAELGRHSTGSRAPEICVHFSCKFQHVRGSQAASLQRLHALMAELGNGFWDASSHVLLVSGSKKPSGFDSLAVLRLLKCEGEPEGMVNTGNQLAAGSATKHQQQGPDMEGHCIATVRRSKRARHSLAAPGRCSAPAVDAAAPGHPQVTRRHAGLQCKLAVAYNPYLPVEGGQQEQERRRLRAKLETGLIHAVYLQIGSDVQALSDGLEFLKRCIKDVSSSSSTPRIHVFGSVLVPSKRLLAQMRFRPWHGVFLSQEYLSGVPAAEEVTRQVLGLYAQHGVTPLVETPIRSEQDLHDAQQLLSVMDKHM